MTSPLFLDFPNANYPVILTTDASRVGIGGTLQVINGQTHNLYYHSQVTYVESGEFVKKAGAKSATAIFSESS